MNRFYITSLDALTSKTKNSLASSSLSPNSMDTCISVFPWLEFVILCGFFIIRMRLFVVIVYFNSMIYSFLFQDITNVSKIHSYLFCNLSNRLSLIV